MVMGHWTEPQDIGQGHGTKDKAMGHRTGAVAWPARFLGLGAGPGPMAHDVGPMFYGLVLCPVALSHVLWPCPMSYGPVAHIQF